MKARCSDCVCSYGCCTIIRLRYVTEKARGLGIGKGKRWNRTIRIVLQRANTMFESVFDRTTALILYCAKEAKTRGCARFQWSVLDWNEPARKFYAKLGAKELTGKLHSRARDFDLNPSMS